MLVRLAFCDFGWWTTDAAGSLLYLLNNGDMSGWFGVTPPPGSEPFFVSGARTAEEAIAAGMPAAAVNRGKISRPSTLLDVK